MSVRYTRPASADLDDCLGFVAQQAPEAARRFLVRLADTETLLAQFPQAGAQTRLPWLRRMRVSATPYVLFYEVAKPDIIVHAVRHSARDPATMPDQ